MMKGRNINMNNVIFHNYIRQFFLAHHCQILDENNTFLHIQLTVEMDKALMNRPFYWHYLEKIGEKGQPLTLTLYFDRNTPQPYKGEYIHFGSPRAQQIFRYVKQSGAWIRLYEEPSQKNPQTSLYPWLHVNGKILFQCDIGWEKFFSIGLNLINGQMRNHFYDELHNKKMSKKIPDYSFTLSPLITPKSGLKRIKEVLKTIALGEDLTSFEKAKIRWKEDIALLWHFYTEEERKTNSLYQKEMVDLQNLYEPKIQICFLHGGIFYLQ